LLELFVRLKGVGLANGMSFELPLTQELIGDAIGLTTVHVNRTMRSLREDKLIAIDDKRVTILDFEGLSLICDFENSYLSAAVHAIGKDMNSPQADALARPKRPHKLVPVHTKDDRSIWQEMGRPGSSPRRQFADELAHADD
jgi:hypothetical protein